MYQNSLLQLLAKRSGRGWKPLPSRIPPYHNNLQRRCCINSDIKNQYRYGGIKGALHSARELRILILFRNPNARLTAMQRLKYKITNWREYNKSLVSRGSVTLWLSDDVAEGWYGDSTGGERGRPQVYSEAAIQFFLTIKYMYDLPYRSTQGFVDSLLKLAKLDVKSPCYTQACRRSEALAVKPEPISKAKGHRDIVVDSTGLKVYGEGEWKVRKHGASKRRTWRKLHLAVDPATHEILAHSLTGNDAGDGEEFPGLIDSVAGEIGDCMGDGAYDTKDCHEKCRERGAKLVAPPRRGAVVQKPGKETPGLALRDDYVKRIAALTEETGDAEEARKRWKKETGYHRRSIGETAMFRFKTICGPKLSSRQEPKQKTEVAVKVNILNRFTKLGMPVSVPVQIAA